MILIIRTNGEQDQFAGGFTCRLLSHGGYLCRDDNVRCLVGEGRHLFGPARGCSTPLTSEIDVSRVKDRYGLVVIEAIPYFHACQSILTVSFLNLQIPTPSALRRCCSDDTASHSVRCSTPAQPDETFEPPIAGSEDHILMGRCDWRHRCQPHHIFNTGYAARATDPACFS